MIQVGNYLYKLALTQKEIDQLNQLTDEELGALSPEVAHGIVEAVTDDTLRLKKHVKGLESFFGRLRASRLLALAEEYEGAILEYETIVLRVTEAKPGKPYAKIMKALLKARPELTELIEDLTQAELEKIKPTKKVWRYRKKEEPKSWKSLPREQVPIEPYRRGAVPQLKVDVRYFEQLINRHLDVMDYLIEDLETL